MRKSGGNPQVKMFSSEPRLLVDWLAHGIEAAALLPETEVCMKDLPNCRAFRLLPTQQVFFPTMVKLSTEPWLADVDKLVESGYSFDGKIKDGDLKSE